MEVTNATGRLEAFSDGVFAIAITLLILEIKVPEAEEGRSLAQALATQWPSYVAFVVSFATIGIMWINHHRMFTHIQRLDHTLLMFNLVLLFATTFIPFPTAVLASYLAPHTWQIDADQRTAAMLYNGTFIVMALVFNRLWAYASANNRLLGSNPDHQGIQQINQSYRFGPLLYIGIFVVGLLNVPASLALNLVFAVFYALPGRQSVATHTDAN